MLTEFNGWESDHTKLEKFFDWIRFTSNIKSLKLSIDDNLTEIKNEIIPKVHVSVPHREGEGKGWKAITLYGYSSLMTDDDSYYQSNGFDLPETKSWTSISNFFPKTKQWIIENIPFSKFGRVRLMVLEPGGYIAPHRDYPRGQCLAGINIAINHPANIQYIVGGEEIIWQEGDSRLIDIGSTHEIYNNSNESRVHIIVHSDPIDVWSVEMMHIVCDSYTKLRI